ncbi:TetR/AcrR family transcriptional regulator [bacterium]|nr:TetR/AcrR family transcriptional regulator [bacterium]
MAKIINREEKKAQILEAALQVIGRKGTAGTKIQDIAEEAGIGKGTIYLYYKNKEEIFQSILEQHIGSRNHNIQEVMNSSSSPEEKVRYLLESFTGSIEHSPYPPGLQLEILASLVRSGPDSSLSQGILQFRELLSQLLKDIQQTDSVEPLHQNLSSALIGLLHGLIIIWSTNKEAFPLQEIVSDTAGFIIDALTKNR